MISNRQWNIASSDVTQFVEGTSLGGGRGLDMKHQLGMAKVGGGVDSETHRCSGRRGLIATHSFLCRGHKRMG